MNPLLIERLTGADTDLADSPTGQVDTEPYRLSLPASSLLRALRCTGQRGSGARRRSSRCLASRCARRERLRAKGRTLSPRQAAPPPKVSSLPPLPVGAACLRRVPRVCLADWSIV
eukprot:2840599-Pyramimonas_sp.AAC.1